LGDHVPPLVVLGGRAVWAGDVQEGFGEALDEADLFFQAEMPAVQGWSFGPADAAGVTQPVLNVLGARSVPRFVEGSELIRSWFPQAERLSVPDAGHMLMLQNAAGLRMASGTFFAAQRSSAGPGIRGTGAVSAASERSGTS
jgi:pimeloyl-ACP methyl ester carboxylesterase